MSVTQSVDTPSLIDIYRNLYLARRFEEILAELFRRGEIDGWLHSGLGQEMVGAVLGVILAPDDYIVPYHRSKSTFLARGVPPDILLAEIMGRQAGLCGGVGGEIHVADISRGIFGSTGIVGGALPIALGAAFKQMYHHTGGIAVCGFGDGATTQGSFHESLNLAALWDLPLVFICENNFFSEMTPLHKEMKEIRIAHKAQAYGMPGREVDGYDLDAVHGVLTEAADLARNGGGPSLIEVKTYRWHGHYEGDPESYRDPAETLKWRARDPVRTLRDRLKAQAAISAAGLLAIEQDVEERLHQAVRSAQASPFPSSHSLASHVYADPRDVPGGEGP